MTDSDTDDTAGEPDNDPDIVDPMARVAELFETGEVDIELDGDQDPADLREFVREVERGEHGEIDAALEGQVRMIRAILDEQNDE